MIVVLLFLFIVAFFTQKIMIAVAAAVLAGAFIIALSIKLFSTTNTGKTLGESIMAFLERACANPGKYMLLPAVVFIGLLMMLPIIFS